MAMLKERRRMGVKRTTTKHHDCAGREDGDLTPVQRSASAG